MLFWISHHQALVYPPERGWEHRMGHRIPSVVDEIYKDRGAESL
jgi:hypothetical protein